MYVKGPQGETEAIGPAVWAGVGQVWLVKGQAVDWREFAEYEMPPERRYTTRRTVDRRRQRKQDHRRVYARRFFDRITEHEMMALMRGIHWTV